MAIGYLALALVLAVTGLLEFYGLVEKRGLVCFKWFGVVTGVVLSALGLVPVALISTLLTDADVPLLRLPLVGLTLHRAVDLQQEWGRVLGRAVAGDWSQTASPMPICWVPCPGNSRATPALSPDCSNACITHPAVSQPTEFTVIRTVQITAA